MATDWFTPGRAGTGIDAADVLQLVGFAARTLNINRYPFFYINLRHNHFPQRTLPCTLRRFSYNKLVALTFSCPQELKSCPAVRPSATGPAARVIASRSTGRNTFLRPDPTTSARATPRDHATFARSGSIQSRLLEKGNLDTAGDGNTVRVILDSYLKHAETKDRASTFRLEATSLSPVRRPMGRVTLRLPVSRSTPNR